MNTLQILVRRDHLATARLRQIADTDLAQGQVQVRIDSFALTSNNITYAAFGDAMNYWQFFPTGEDGWGMVPVWGFGEVVRSTHPDMPLGERLYGYYPMASSIVEAPKKSLSARKSSISQDVINSGRSSACMSSVSAV